MGNSCLCTTVFACVTAFVFSAQAGQRGAGDVYEVNFIGEPGRALNTRIQAELRRSDAWQQFALAHDGWYVIYDEQNRKPHRAFGKPVTVQAGADAPATAMNFIRHHLAGFGIPYNELRFTGHRMSGKYHYVDFRQVHKGLPVLHSRLTVKMTGDFRVVMFGADVYDDIDMDVYPSVAADAAALRAARGIPAADVLQSVAGDGTGSRSASLSILPVPGKTDYSYRLVYPVTVRAFDESGKTAEYQCLVDAHNGELLYRKNIVKRFAHGGAGILLQGSVYPQRPTDSMTVAGLPNVKLDAEGTAYYTDSAGYVNLPLSSDSAADLRLDGRWARVYLGGSGFVMPALKDTLSPGSNTISFDGAVATTAVNAYYHADKMHGYMKSFFPSFTGLDFPFGVRVDRTECCCDAWYSNNEINFLTGATTPNCYATSLFADIVYHEYGHAVNDKFYQANGASFNNNAMDEGYCDVWAIGLTGYPVVAEGLMVGNPAWYGRRYDTEKRIYPDDVVGEPHADGQIIAGAWYDVAVNMGSLQQMMELFTRTYNGLANGPDGTEGKVYLDILIDALQEDDDDGDVSNGTPNDKAIVDAFAAHGIYILSDAVLDHDELLAAPANQPVIINAGLNAEMFAWAAAAITVHYRLSDVGYWFSQPMASAGGNQWTVQLPPQPEGTILYYYLTVTDKYGYAAASPAGADRVNPNIPFTAMIGFTMQSVEDFDANMGAWTVGLPSDNAKSGKWIVAVPVPSYVNPADTSTIVQPGTDFGEGADTQCAVTGNAGSPSSPIATADVDMGVTSLVSPVFNLDGYKNPAFTYRRWFINDAPGTDNKGDDYLETWITGDGNAWTKIERTAVSDASWRRFAFRVKDYIPPTATVQLKFMVSDSIRSYQPVSGSSVVEAALDNLELWEAGSFPITVDENAGPEFAVGIFPNPAADRINVQIEGAGAGDVQMTVINSAGVLVRHRIFDKSYGSENVFVEGLAPGLYLFHFIAGEQMLTKKVVITE